jgi:hypothetical protein
VVKFKYKFAKEGAAMGKCNRRLIALSMGLLLMLSAFWGCADKGEPAPTQTDTTAATLPGTTSPFEKEEPMIPVTRPMEGNTEGVKQLRLHDVRRGWMASFQTDNGAFLLATSVETLMSGLSKRGIDPAALDLAAYDDRFFAENYLVVIPRSTSSGSVTFSARVDKTDAGVRISTVGKMPPVGTSDMADWLVLVPLETAEYPGVVTVKDVKSVTPNTHRYATHRF